MEMSKQQQMAYSVFALLQYYAGSRFLRSGVSTVCSALLATTRPCMLDCRMPQSYYMNVKLSTCIEFR